MENQPQKETFITEKFEKTVENKDRWIRIGTPELEVVVSSRNPEDTLETINKLANENFEKAKKIMGNEERTEVN